MAGPPVRILADPLLFALPTHSPVRHHIGAQSFLRPLGQFHTAQILWSGRRTGLVCAALKLLLKAMNRPSMLPSNGHANVRGRLSCRALEEMAEGKLIAEA